MKLKIPEIQPEERTPLVESLLALLQQLLDRVQQLEETNQQLRDEIAILKGQKPRPKIRPSRLESSQPPPLKVRSVPAHTSVPRTNNFPCPPKRSCCCRTPFLPGPSSRAMNPKL